MSIEQLAQLNTVMAPAAVAVEKSAGIPAELMLAQCALESAWLAHAPGNNAFGIKDYSGSPGRQLLDTYEWFTDAELARFLSMGDSRAAVEQAVNSQPNGRRLYRVKDWFAAFPDLAACFAKYAQKFTTSLYKPMLAAYGTDHDLQELITALARVYATSPTYALTLQSIIRMPEVTTAIAAARRQSVTASA